MRKKITVENESFFGFQSGTNKTSLKFTMKIIEKSYYSTNSTEIRKFWFDFEKYSIWQFNR